MEGYDLPFYQKSSMKWSYKLLFFISGIILLAFSIFILGDEEADIVLRWIINPIMIVLSLWMIYVVISIDILKKYYIKIDDEFIEVKQLWIKRKISFKDIVFICESQINNNETIGILLEKDLKKKMKRSVDKAFRDITGEPPISFHINMMFFSSVDRSKLYITIKRKLDSLDSEEKVNSELDNDDSFIEEENNWRKALIYSFLAFIVSVIVYLSLLWLLDTNFLVIPICASYLIISVFNKYYIEKNINFKARFYLGFLCFLQIPIATIICILIECNLTPSFFNIIGAIIGYTEVMMGDIKNSILILLSMIGCFFIGSFVGRVKKLNENEYSE